MRDRAFKISIILALLMVLGVLQAATAAGDSSGFTLAPRLRMELSKRGFGPGDIDASPGKTQPLSTPETISVLVHLAPGEAAELENWLRNTGGVLRLNTGSTAAVRLPINLVSTLAGCSFVRYLTLPQKTRPMLDLSLPDIRADKVHSPTQDSLLPREYTGKGVVIGMIDTGLDWRHQDFINTDGTTRILYLWDQTDNRGPSPGAPFTSGTEYSREDINQALQGNGTVYQKDTYGHGTHVTGIAAGNGLAAGGFKGVAPEAYLIIVKTTFWIDDIEVALDYITGIAGELGQPCVINMSLGTHYGPHDGSSHFCQTLDEFSGEGTVMVVSAGNEGNEDNHLGYLASSTSRETPFYFEYGVRNGYVDIWYDQPGEVDFRVQAFNLIGLELADSGWVAPGESTSTTIEGPVITYGTVEVDATETENPLNEGRHVVINATSGGRRKIDRGSVKFLLHARGTGYFDAWIDDGYFYPSDHGETYSGNSEKSVGMPGTAARAITVANYVSKNSWPDLNGTTRSHWEAVGPLTISSSKGPSRREDLTGFKPEIAAPGTYIASALSGDDSAPASSTTPDGEHYLIHGTSMSAPHVTGTIALMFEANPGLTPEEVETYLIEHARQDDFVGDTIPNYSWGYGKLDTLAVMEALTGEAQPPVQPPVEELPEIDIQGNSRSIASADTTPETADHTSFGNVFVSGTALTRTFTIVNSGSAVLTLTGDPRIAINGTQAGDFSVVLDPAASLAPGEETTFQIRFDPAAEGPRQATVTIANSDEDENPYTFAIQGSGVLQVHSISGKVTFNGGAALPGVQISIGETSTVPAGGVTVKSAIAITDSTGYYEATGFTDGTYQITPSKEGFVFEPPSPEVAVSGAGAVRDFAGFGLPVAEAGAAPLSGTVPLLITFTGTGTDPEDNLVKYEWDFNGDGTYDWESVISGDTTHTYTLDGVFEARLRVTDGDEYTATGQIRIQADPSQPPVAGLSAEPASGTAPLEVELNGTGTDPDGTITGFNWDFEGDGWFDHRSASTKRITHVYRVPGIYQPTLQVTDNAGLADTASVTIAVDTPPVNPEVILSADLDPVEGMAPLTVIFTVETTDFAGEISTLEWDFDGDGMVDEISASGEQVTHTYGQVGTFTATVTVTDSTGASASDMIDVVVTPDDKRTPPAILISIDYLTGTVPYEAHLVATVSDGDGVVVSVTWDVDGDGLTDLTSAVNSGGLQVTATAVHIYHQPGSYRVRVTAIDDDGLTRTGLIDVFVQAPDSLSVWITHPAPGRAVSGTAVSLAAATSSDEDTAAVVFQYRADDGAWAPVGTTTDHAAPYTAAWDTSALAPGSFQLRVQAEDGDSNLTWSEAVTVTVDHDSPDSREDGTVEGTITRQETVFPDSNADLLLSDGTAVFIPYGTLDTETSIIIGVLGNEPPENVPDVTAAALVRGGTYREFTLQSGQTSFNNAVTLTLPYADDDDNGLVDGTVVQETDLTVFWYDEQSSPAAWKEEQAVLVFPDENYVEARVNHFSVFTLVETPEPEEVGGGTVVSSSDGGGGGCFIATAAYGSLDDPTVKRFREFRDRRLLRNPWGQQAVRLYYQLSPPLAAIIAGDDNLRLGTKIVLNYIAFYLKN